jgi:hypothetical protein
MVDPPTGTDFSMAPSFSWDYAGFDPGEHNIVFAAEASGNVAYDTLILTIIDNDNPPYIDFRDGDYNAIKNDRDTVTVGDQYHCTVVGDDPDYDNVTISVVQAPSEISLDMYDNFSWSPVTEDAGMNELIFSAASRNKLIYDTLMLYVHDPDGVSIEHQRNPGSTVDIYPVPADEATNIQITKAGSGKAVVSVIDMKGRIVREKVFSIHGNTCIIEHIFAGLPTGEYIVDVDYPNGLSQKKILVK